MRQSLITLLVCSVGMANAKGLLDEAVAAPDTQRLDSAAGNVWTVTAASSTTSSSQKTKHRSTVPGDLLTDLERAGVIGDPLYETNFKSTVWDATNWTVATTFTVDDDLLPQEDAVTDAKESKSNQIELVFDGVKMGAWVHLDGVYLGTVQDQFLRYRYDVTSLLSATASRKEHTLTLTFAPSNHSINTEARWMACSGAWDWAPYTSTYNDQGAHTMSKGIWKSVYLIGTSTAAGDNQAALEHLQPYIYYNGTCCRAAVLPPLVYI